MPFRRNSAAVCKLTTVRIRTAVDPAVLLRTIQIEFHIGF